MTKRRIISAIDLQKIIQADVDLIKEVIADSVKVSVGLPYWHEDDEHGGNWDISNIRNIDGYEADVAVIVRRHMQTYNLQNP